ncbi:putative serpin-Z8 [Lolium rigidum]|uniref:putative serpin-Z8 n=1 Tax=Lolium rigidum TaxID=89674 RepID=UPI001F5D6718|nr:putative serpin-Z8 [Lolium rigidum]
MAGPSKKKSRQSGAGLAGLAARLTKRLADENPRTNLVFSPLSIYTAVSLLAPGARGDTLDEILRLLGARSRHDLEESIATTVADALKDRSGSGGPTVAFGYGVWNDTTRPLKPAYRQAVVGTYRAEARALDFHGNAEDAAGQINAWVADVTTNLITDVVSARSFTTETDVVLANAIYFKGKWDMPFYERNTKDRPFHLLDGAAIDAPFMYNSSRHFIAVHDGFKVLKLRYKMQQQQDYYRSNTSRTPNSKKDTQYSMCIFLPDAHDGLHTLLDEITSRPGFVRDHLPSSTVKVGDFGVPKFKLEFTSNVKQVLKHLGLVLPFGMGADLSDMMEADGSRLPLLVHDVFHKAVIEVNEEGTVAAAVTMMPAPAGCAPMRKREPTVDFVADHPFAYFIVEEASGAILFAGHVVDPTDGKAPPRTGKHAAMARGHELLPKIRNPPRHFYKVGPQIHYVGLPKRPTSSTGLATLAARLAGCLAERSADKNLAEASAVDFRHAPEEAREQINAWAAQKTRNLIDSVLPPGSIKPTTPVVLGNALYFNGAWEDEPFDKRGTMQKTFHKLDGSHVDVPLMQSRRRQFVAVHDGFKVLKLQYKMVEKDRDDPYGHPHDTTQFSMCIFLPDALDGLQGLLHTIASKPGFLQHHLPQCRVDVREIRVPKFKLSFHKSVVPVLEKLGLKLPFSAQANLSDMVEDDGSRLPIMVGNIIHKAVIEVNEEGTEAAAVTMVITKLGHSRWQHTPQLDFVADHPFAFYIVEEATGAVVFAGHVLDPSKEE